MPSNKNNHKKTNLLCQNPYNGPTAPARQRTLDAFAAAVAQAKTILGDPALCAEWQQRFRQYTARVNRYPSSYPKPCTTLRGYIISTFTREARSDGADGSIVAIYVFNEL